MPEQKLPSLIGKSNMNTEEDYMNKREMHCFSHSATLQLIKLPFLNKITQSKFSDHVIETYSITS